MCYPQSQYIKVEFVLILFLSAQSTGSPYPKLNTQKSGILQSLSVTKGNTKMGWKKYVMVHFEGIKPIIFRASKKDKFSREIKSSA